MGISWSIEVYKLLVNYDLKVLDRREDLIEASDKAQVYNETSSERR